MPGCILTCDLYSHSLRDSLPTAVQVTTYRYKYRSAAVCAVLLLMLIRVVSLSCLGERPLTGPVWERRRLVSAAPVRAPCVRYSCTLGYSTRGRDLGGETAFHRKRIVNGLSIAIRLNTPELFARDLSFRLLTSTASLLCPVCAHARDAHAHARVRDALHTAAGQVKRTRAMRPSRLALLALSLVAGIWLLTVARSLLAALAVQSTIVLERNAPADYAAVEAVDTLRPAGMPERLQCAMYAGPLRWRRYPGGRGAPLKSLEALSQTSLPPIKRLGPPRRALLPFNAYMLRVLADGGPVAQASATNAAFLRSLSQDRLFWSFRQAAGLRQPRGARPFGGWERPGAGIRGHFTGHYLAALALGGAGGDDSLVRLARSALAVLAECQQAHRAADPSRSGYLAAFLPVEFEKVEALGHGPHGDAWVPHYATQKVLSGSPHSGMCMCIRHVAQCGSVTDSANDPMIARAPMRPCARAPVRPCACACPPHAPARRVSGLLLLHTELGLPDALPLALGMAEYVWLRSRRLAAIKGDAVWSELLNYEVGASVLPRKSNLRAQCTDVLSPRAAVRYSSHYCVVRCRPLDCL